MTELNQALKNKISAFDNNINKLLKEQKFTIDYFQREYRWRAEHIKLLIEDLTSTFMKSYKAEHKPEDVANYQSYFLGTCVFSINTENGKKSIIDGQQRITSITLFLIYLNHLQKDFNENDKINISELIFSVKHRVKSFNMTDESREECLKSLFENGNYEIKESDNETINNMVERYYDIAEVFPEELTQNALPFFIDWFIENVIIVEIIAYSDENAYAIFETMNDRGLKLTPTEMLKGYILSKITDKKHIIEINEIWKNEIQKLHEYGDTVDQSFFQAWFRGKYAVSIRLGKVGSEDRDFELIGSRFHNWFKDNHRNFFDLNTSIDFYNYFKNQFPFYVKWYINICKAQVDFDTKMPHTNYIKFWGIAESLQNSMLLASINYEDDENLIKKKIDFVSRYIETFTVRRAINYRKFGQTSIKYTMFNLIKLIRNNEINSLSNNLTQEVERISENWDAIFNFGLHGMNRNFVKHLLCRITSYIDSLIGIESNYSMYHHPNNRQYEIEHIWANKFEEHRNEFEQEGDFQKFRNLIGALILLPQGTNQSFSSDRYEDKVDHYLKQNAYAQALHKANYEKNPNFLNSQIIKIFEFKFHNQFKKEDVIYRQNLVKRICEKLWDVEYFKII